MKYVVAVLSMIFTFTFAALFLRACFYHELLMIVFAPTLAYLWALLGIKTWHEASTITIIKNEITTEQETTPERRVEMFHEWANRNQRVTLR